VTQRRPTSGLASIGVASAALVLGHWAAYMLAYRQIRLRDAVLAQTGHSYVASAGRLAFVVCFLALAWFGTEACTRESQTEWRGPRFGPLAGRLIGVQIIGFSALEIVERVVARAPVMEMLGHYTFALGLVMQVLTALAASLVILLLTRTVRHVYLLITARRRAVRANLTLGPAHSGQSIALGRGLVGATGVRGPPETSNF
jgi:hypothetical protein